MEKFKFFGVLCIVIIIAFLSYVKIFENFNNKEYNHPSIELLKWNGTSIDSEHAKQLLQKLVLIAKHIEYSYKHSKGMKTSAGLRAAKNEISKVLSSFNLDFDNVTKPVEYLPQNVCPEKYMGTKFGYPFYEKGFIVDENCTKTLSNLITITLDLRFKKGSSIEKILSAIRKYESFDEIIVTVNNGTLDKLKSVKSKYRNVKIFQHDKNTSVGFVWNDMISRVKTEYLLVSRDITDFDIHARIDRLIRELEIQNKSVATGAMRDKNGRWRIGCYQRAFRNYTLVYYEGYDTSFHECLICDHVDGPLVMKTKFAKKYSFNKEINGSGVFEEFFIRIGNEQTINCPDAMFYVDQSNRSRNHKDWAYFSKLLQVWKLKFIPGFEIVFPCIKPYKCNKGKYYFFHPCCVKELTIMNLLCMEVCNKAHAVCELDSGTLMSAVKLGRVAPWEVDGDFMFVSSNYSIVSKAAKTASNVSEFKLRPITRPKRSKDGKFSGGFLQMNSRNWFIEAWGMPKLTSEKFLLEGKGQTKVWFYDRWINVGNNPGLMARNRYGYEIYRHAIHWRYLGFKSSWINYSTHHFPKCIKPGDQKCFDLIGTDGNLHFIIDPLP